MAGLDRLLEFMLKAALPEKYGDRVRIDIREETRRIAAEMGLTPEETEAAVAEADAILKRRRDEQRRRT